MNKLEFQPFKSLRDWMATQDPALLLRLRRANGWLVDHLPEVGALYGVPQDACWHPEIDTGIHTEMTLARSADLTDDPAVRFASLVHDLGKGLTDPSLLPKHVGHEASGVPLVDSVCNRFEVPEDWRKLSKLVCQYHLHSHRALELSSRGVIQFFREAGFYESPELLEPFLLACQADKQGRLGMEQAPYPQRDFLRYAYDSSSKVVVEDLDRLNQSRVAAASAARKSF